MYVSDQESGGNILKLSEGDPGVNRRLELLCYDDEIDFEEVGPVFHCFNFLFCLFFLFVFTVQYSFSAVVNCSVSVSIHDFLLVYCVCYSFMLLCAVQVWCFVRIKPGQIVK